MAIPVGIAYSPPTKTDGVTLIGAATISIDAAEGEGIGSFPTATALAPGVAVLCSVGTLDSLDPADYETVTYTGIAGNDLTGVTRDVEGVAREWPDGTAIFSPGTAWGWEQVRTAVNGKLNKAGDTMTGDLDMDGNEVQNADIVAYKEPITATSGTGARVLDLEDGNVFEHTVSADVATSFDVDNDAVGHSFTLILHQHADGPAITWTFAPLWPNNAPPPIWDAKTHVFTFVKITKDSAWLGHLAGHSYGAGV